MRIVLVVALLSVAVAGTASAAPDASCRAAALRGSVAVIPGSAGAGSISYALRLQNVSAQTCAVSGLPQVRLLDRLHRALPTHVRTSRPGLLTAVLVRIRPGGWTVASARFSPDVPGPGEPVAGTVCEHTAVALRVSAPGGGSVVVPIRPATPVCEHGTMTFSVYVAGKKPPLH
jgi:hypothetical protein